MARSSAASGQRPRALQRGDRVVVVAPSSSFEAERFEAGLRVLESMGLHISMEPSVSSRWRYLAGDDDVRTHALQAALCDPGVRCVWAARGGYGAMRLLDRIDWAQVVTAPPRWLVGFSDITALHCAWLQKGRAGAVHGPNVTTLAGLGQTDLRQLVALLFGQQPAATLGAEQLRVLRRGKAEGLLWGGNLSLISRLIGTGYLPETAGSILFLEDVGERPYRLDRMITHLRLSGLLDSLAGVVLGAFTGCEEAEAGYAVTEVLDELLEGLACPVLAGYPAGHGVRLRSLPLGIRVRVQAEDGEAGRLEVLDEPWDDTPDAS